ncbi:MAG: hypothetical protein EZS28_055754, partial [Streblomastix strix]
DNVESVCKDGESKMSYLVCGTAQCLKGNALQIGGAVDGICVQQLQTWGHFSTYSGSSSAIEYIILFGVVFAQRELVNWYFCRDLVTIGTATLMAAFYMIYEPYSRNTGNIMITSRYCIYGTVRLLMEIAYAVER